MRLAQWYTILVAHLLSLVTVIVGRPERELGDSGSFPFFFHPYPPARTKGDAKFFHYLRTRLRNRYLLKIDEFSDSKYKFILIKV